MPGGENYKNGADKRKSPGVGARNKTLFFVGQFWACVVETLINKGIQRVSGHFESR